MFLRDITLRLAVAEPHHGQSDVFGDIEPLLTSVVDGRVLMHQMKILLWKMKILPSKDDVFWGDQVRSVYICLRSDGFREDLHDGRACCWRRGDRGDVRPDSRLRFQNDAGAR